MSEVATPDKQWLHVGGEVEILGPAVVRVIATRSNECRLEVVTCDLFEWRKPSSLVEHRDGE